MCQLGVGRTQKLVLLFSDASSRESEEILTASGHGLTPSSAYSAGLHASGYHTPEMTTASEFIKRERARRGVLWLLVTNLFTPLCTVNVAKPIGRVYTISV